MAQFLLSVHVSDDGPREAPSDEDSRRGFEKIAQVEDELRAAEALVYSARLEGAAHARVARPSRGRVRTTDGPFAETKEQLGGFYIIAADDLAAAIGWASKVALAIDMPIEVRPFLDWRAG
jgi:hypothetical protein